MSEQPSEQPSDPVTTDGATVHAIIDVAAPPARVFAALTEPAQLEAWWGSDETFRTHDWELVPAAGERWRARTTDAAGNPGTVEGEVRVADAPHTLELTWEASWDEAGPTIVRWELMPAIVHGRPGTRVIVTHECGARAASRITGLARYASQPFFTTGIALRRAA